MHTLAMIMDAFHPDLDDLDISLIRALDADAKQSYIQLAEKLPASRNTVRRRLQRLLDDRIVSLVTLTSPPAFGYRTHATMAITANPGDAEAVAERLVSFANIPYLLTTTGRYDIIAASIFQNLDEMLYFIDSELGSVSGLSSTDVLVGVNWMKFCLNPLTSTNHAFPAIPRPRVLDDTDLGIIRELEVDPAQTNLALANKLGINRSTVQKRIQALIESDIISIGTIIDPFAIGYQVLAVLLVKARPGEINNAASKMMALREITNLIKTAGAYDMIAYANFRDSRHMSEFMNSQIGQIAGIIRVESMIVLSAKKLSFRLLTLGLPPVQNSTLPNNTK